MPYSSTRSARPRIIVLHTGEGILDRSDMARFLDNNPDASAHASSDAGGFQAPLVPYDKAAWTAGPTANNIGLHIEMCAFAQMTRDQWLSESDVTIWIQWLNNGAGAWRTIRSPASMLRWTAAWVRSVAAQYGIPIEKLTAAQVRAGQAGICGHADTSAAFGETDHTDPGGNFPWDVFINLVTQQEEKLNSNDGNVFFAAAHPEDPKHVENHKFADWIGFSAYRGADSVGLLREAKLIQAEILNAVTGDDFDAQEALARMEKGAREGAQQAVGTVVVPALRAVLREQLGEDNAALANEIVDQLANRLRPAA